MSVRLAYGTVNPTALCIVLVHYVVKVSTESHLFQSEELLFEVQRVCDICIHHFVGRQRTRLILAVVEILTAHVL